MASEEIPKLTASGIARRIRDGDLTPTEVLEAHLERIEERNDRTNAFVTVTESLARESAREIEAAIENGEPLGPLGGVPVAIKDLNDVAGVKTTSGSLLYEDRTAEADDPFVARLKDAGAIVVGKTNTPEFGLGVQTDNRVAGPTSTPFDSDRTAGGSSGGAGAALGDFLVPIAQGSDTGGSVRIPAACCGVYGLKPTYGLIPRPERPNAFGSHTPFTHHGPMSRTVEDAARMLQAMAGSHPRDPFSLSVDADYVSATSRPIEGMRVAYSPDLGTYPIDPRVREVLDEAIVAFEDAGATVERVDPDLGRTNDEIVEAFYDFANVKWRALLDALEDDGFDPYGEDRDRLRPYLVELILDAEEVDFETYGEANVVRTDVLDGLADVFDEYDVLASATTAVPPPKIGERPETIDGEEIEPLRGWLLTQPYNFTGQPAASIPAGFTDDGLPIGMQIAAERHRDDAVLAASAAFERNRPWYDAYPE